MQSGVPISFGSNYGDQQAQTEQEIAEKVQTTVVSYLKEKGLQDGVDLSAVGNLASNVSSLQTNFSQFLTLYDQDTAVLDGEILNIKNQYVSSTSIANSHYDKTQTDQLLAPINADLTSIGQDMVLVKEKQALYTAVGNDVQDLKSVFYQPGTTLAAFPTTEEVQKLITDSAPAATDLTGYYTKAEIDQEIGPLWTQSDQNKYVCEQLELKLLNVDGTAKFKTEEEIQTQIDATTDTFLYKLINPDGSTTFLNSTQIQTLIAQATDPIDAEITALKAKDTTIEQTVAANYATLDTKIDNAVLASGGQTVDLSGYYTQAQIDGKVADLTAEDSRQDTLIGQNYADLDGRINNITSMTLTNYMTKMQYEDVLATAAGQAQQATADITAIKAVNNTQTARIDALETVAIANLDDAIEDSVPFKAITQGLQVTKRKTTVNPTTGEEEVDPETGELITEEVQDLTEFYPREYIDLNFYKKSEIDAADYLPRAFWDVNMSTVTATKFLDYFTKTEIDTHFLDYFTKTEIDTRFLDYFNRTEMEQTYVSKTLWNTNISTRVLEELGNYYTKAGADTLFVPLTTLKDKFALVGLNWDTNQYANSSVTLQTLMDYARIDSFPEGFSFGTAVDQANLDGYLKLADLPEGFNVTLAVDSTQLNAALSTYHTSTMEPRVEFLIARDYAILHADDHARLDAVEITANGAVQATALLDYPKISDFPDDFTFNLAVTSTQLNSALSTYHTATMEPRVEFLIARDYVTLFAPDKLRLDNVEALANTLSTTSALKTDLDLYPKISDFPEDFVFNLAMTTTQFNQAMQTYQTVTLPPYVQAEMENYMNNEGEAQVNLQIDTKLLNHYTKSAADARIDEKITARMSSSGTFDSSQYYTMAAVDTFFLKKVDADFVPYSDLNQQILNNGFIKTAAIDTKIATAVTNNNDDYYDKTTIDAAHAGFQTKAALNADLQTLTYKTENQIDTKISAATSSLQNKFSLDVDVGLLGYQKESQVDSKISIVSSDLATNYYTKTQIDTDYYTAAEVDQTITNRLNSTGTFDSSLYYLKTEVDTLLSALQGQITAMQNQITALETFQADSQPLINQIQPTVDSSLLNTQKITALQLAKADIETKNAEQDTLLAGLRTDVDAITAASWDETRVTSIESAVQESKLVLHHSQVICQDPLLEVFFKQGTNRQVSVGNWFAHEPGFFLQNFYNMSGSSVLANPIGINQAYSLQATDVLISNYTWTSDEGDTRLAGNPQIKIDLTGFRDKINTAVGNMAQFFNDQDQTRTNASFFEWSLEIESSGILGTQSGGHQTSLFHIVQSAPLGAYLTNNVYNQATTEQAQLWFQAANKVATLWIRDNERESFTLNTSTQRFSLDDDTVKYVGMGRNINQNYGNIDTDYDYLKIRVLIHPRGSLSTIV